MKVALTGAQGTGKTTMAKYIAEKWGIPYIGSVARETMKAMGYTSEYDFNHLSEGALLEFQQALITNRRAKLKGLASYVTDRLELDQYVYSLRRCGAALTEAQRSQWEDEAVQELYAMDLVLHTPAGLFPVEEDGIRQADVAHQFLLDAAIYGLLCKHVFDVSATHVYILSMGSLERRQSFVDALCSEIKAMEP
jgi:nicotinamide riboside kinase